MRVHIYFMWVPLILAIAFAAITPQMEYTKRASYTVFGQKMFAFITFYAFFSLISFMVMMWAGFIRAARIVFGKK